LLENLKIAHVWITNVNVKYPFKSVK
jgi:hypothetical protein